MVLVQKWPFFQLCFLGTIGQENMLNYILERINLFLGYKNKKLYKSKNWHFSMVLVQKWRFVQLFFLGNIGQENILNYIQERKNAFLGYKNKMFKKSKNWDFCKGVNPWFWSKDDHFSNFYFLGNIGQ